MVETNSSIEYRNVPGFLGYRVGDDGSVWTCLTLDKRGRGTGRGSASSVSDNWRQLKPQVSRAGRLRVKLYHTVDGRRAHKRFFTYQLVMLAFVGPCPSGLECAHEDGNVLNNHRTNLTYKTRKANHADKHRHGTAQVGERNPNSKFTIEQVLQIAHEHRTTGDGPIKIAKRLGLPGSSVSSVVYGITWSRVTGIPPRYPHLLKSTSATTI